MTFLDTPSEQKYKRNQNPGWTDDKIKQLKILCENGELSAGQIARKLGFATRNAVIGKMHRLGLFKAKIHKPVKQREPGSNIRPQNVCPQIIEKAHYTRKRRLRISLIETPNSPPTQPVYIQPSEYDKNIPLEQRKTLLELNSISCHWPIGDPLKPDFFFCGAITEHTYCDHHMHRAGRA